MPGFRIISPKLARYSRVITFVFTLNVQKVAPMRKKSQTTSQIITKFKKQHGDIYDYSKVEFQGSHTKVIIICPEHGEFQQTPAIHLRGSACPICGKRKKGKNRRNTPEAWLDQARAIHGDRYDYSPTIYRTNRTKITINCKIHGPFEILPYNHIKGSGCKLCNLSSDAQLNGFDPLVEFKPIHGERYDYSNFVYTTSQTPSEIICRDHGSFFQSPYSHKKGHGCPECGRDNTIKSKTYTQNEIINKFYDVHGNLYDYSKTKFIRTESPVTIICKKHGEFQQWPKNHLQGHGCPKCSNTISNAEIQIGDFIETLGIEVIRNTRKLIPPKEIDIYLPEYKLGIEYCGLYWHGEKYGKNQFFHQDKLVEMNRNGLDLITIFEDEWLNSPDVVKSIIKNQLGFSSPGVGGRQLFIQEINSRTSKEFLNLHHIQGAASGKVHLGAFHNDVLVGVMVLGNPTRQTSSYEWELKRFVGDGNSHPGMMGKLFAHFRHQWNPESVVSFSDLRWFSGSSYVTMGFIKEGIIPPDYSYVKHGIRYNKSRYRKSGIKRYHPEIFDENLTEREMMELAGYDKIWDCGKVRWVWTDLNR